jgi:hypothetical protein
VSAARITVRTLSDLAGYDSRRDLDGRWTVETCRGVCRLHVVPCCASRATDPVEVVFDFYGRTVDRVHPSARCERIEP